MEAKQRQYDQYRTSYIEGNTVRKLSAAPDIRREEEQYEVVAPRRQERSRSIAQPGIDLLSLFVLSLAIIATVYVFVEYLKVEWNVSQTEKYIITLEHDLTSLNNQNNAALEQIDKKYDLEYVYKVAVGELGMVYPNKNRIITYKRSTEDYVRQYEDIPDVTNENLLDKILQ